MTVRNRIKELRYVRAGDLIPNPKNWRKHPKPQRDALQAVLQIMCEHKPPAKAWRDGGYSDGVDRCRAVE